MIYTHMTTVGVKGLRFT